MCNLDEELDVALLTHPAVAVTKMKAYKKQPFTCPFSARRDISRTPALIGAKYPQRREAPRSRAPEVRLGITRSAALRSMPPTRPIWSVLRSTGDCSVIYLASRQSFRRLRYAGNSEAGSPAASRIMSYLWTY